MYIISIEIEYDNSVYGNWLRPKGVAKVSGILKGIVAILILKVYMKGWEKDPKGRIKTKNAEKISWFFIYSYSLKKEKERDKAFKAVWRDAKKSDFLTAGKNTKEDTFSVKNGI